MRFFWKIFSKIILLNIIFLSAMSIFRLIFFLYYGQGTDFSGFGADIVKAFYMGIRYDAAVLGYINALVVLAFCVLVFIGRTEYFVKLFKAARIYYTVIMGLVFVFLYIDFEFYSYFQSHLNILAFGIVDDDTNALLSTFHENYNFFIVALKFAVCFVIPYLIARLVLKTSPSSWIIRQGEALTGEGKSQSVVKVVIFLILGLLNFIVIRGTFTMFPLGLPNAEISTNPFINKTAINAFYTFEDAIVVRGEENNIDYIEAAGYKDNIRQAFADYLDKDISEIPQDHPEGSLKINLPYNKDIETSKPNIIFIVMESFGADFIKYNSPQFNILGGLKQHFDEDFLFMNFLPAHHVTIGSLETAIANVARRPNAPYLAQSKYLYNKYDFWGALPYQAKGYETLFFYGGNSGWRGLDSLMHAAGFDKVLGEGTMPSNAPRNQWGIFDGYLFDFIFDEFSKDDKRKFVYVMTMTNHPPFSLPKDWKPKSLIPPETLEKRIINRENAQMRFETYQYACEMLAQFITKVKNSKYGDNTIIAVTGDHNFWGIFQYSSEEALDQIGVPFYLYIPKKWKPSKVDTTVFGSHIDILPTIYYLSLSNTQIFAMGQNLLSKEAQKNIASHDSGAIMDKNYALLYNFQNKSASYYAWDKDNKRKTVQSDRTQGHNKLLKRFLAQTAVADYLIKNTSK
ncbi:MAG: sulfatase-like hydrolase/transferase [Elusimicrobiota bacterium]|nr:sulfatase-like hydrolase/transferase [Elusimicrobiota bacterium]